MSLESRRVLCKNLGQEWREDTSKDEGRGRGKEGEANATKGLVMFEPCKFIHTKEQPKTHTWKTRKKKIKR